MSRWICQIYHYLGSVQVLEKYSGIILLRYDLSGRELLKHPRNEVRRAMQDVCYRAWLLVWCGSHKASNHLNREN